MISGGKIILKFNVIKIQDLKICYERQIKKSL